MIYDARPIEEDVLLVTRGKMRHGDARVLKCVARRLAAS